MDFEHAFNRLKNGYAMRRKLWGKDVSVAIVHGKFAFHMPNIHVSTGNGPVLTHDDILAEDWVPADPFPL